MDNQAILARFCDINWMVLVQNVCRIYHNESVFMPTWLNRYKSGHG